MTDTKEEAEYRQEVRAKLEKEKADKDKAARLKQIKDEEEKRANRKPLLDQAVGFLKEILWDDGKKKR